MEYEALRQRETEEYEALRQLPMPPLVDPNEMTRLNPGAVSFNPDLFSTRKHLEAVSTTGISRVDEAMQQLAPASAGGSWWTAKAEEHYASLESMSARSAVQPPDTSVLAQEQTSALAADL